jgi:hypothetical protein
MTRTGQVSQLLRPLGSVTATLLAERRLKTVLDNGYLKGIDRKNP